MKRSTKKSIQTVARKLITDVNPKSVVAEQFRTIRTNINFSMPDAEIQTILFTSSSPGDGKSTVAANTAVVFAQEGKRVLLVDSDMRKPTVHYTFHLTNTIGLSNALVRQVTLEEIIHQSSIDNLDVITCGPIPPNPSELISSKSMDSFIKEAKTLYDLIIFDAPPVLSVTDAQILANKCEGTILVISANETEKESILKAKEALVASQATIIGTVLNNYILDKDHYYYQYYGTAE